MNCVTRLSNVILKQLKAILRKLSATCAAKLLKQRPDVLNKTSGNLPEETFEICT